MSKFIGRKQELEMLGSVLQKKSASLIVIKGRRRIGKSRLIEEFCKGHRFLRFSGIPPTQDITPQAQRDLFAQQLLKQLNLPATYKGASLDWPVFRLLYWDDLFRLLADHTREGRVIILFDEISWMGSQDPTFLGQFKNAWDLHFKQNDKLVFVLCGSVSSWIQENILGSSGFVGRISLVLNVKELPLPDCAKFWEKSVHHVSAFEKFKVLAVTGGVPLYLEHINPKISAEANITALCFRPEGLLFREFDDIFTDLFSKRSATYKAIVEALANGVLSQEEISHKIGIKRSGDISHYIDDLIQAGFITRDHTWQFKTGKVSNLSRYRVCDNYSRFYLKYINPSRHKIEREQLASTSISDFPNWSTVMGFQFENLVLNNRKTIWEILNPH